MRARLSWGPALALALVALPGCKGSGAPSDLEFVPRVEWYHLDDGEVRASVQWDASMARFHARIWNHRARTIKDVQFEVWTDGGEYVGPSAARSLGPRDGFEVTLRPESDDFWEFAARLTWVDGMAGFGE